MGQSVLTPNFCQQNVKEPEIRAACIQVLFTIVYQLKSAILAYSSDLLKVSLESLKHGSEMERTGGAKLLASLMASDEVIVQSISEGLVEARTLLSIFNGSIEERFANAEKAAHLIRKSTEILIEPH
ncbi:ARM repeat superfamily protein [Tanacetum coccineum]